MARDSIEEYAYDDTSVRFDCPDSLTDDRYTIDMRHEMDGFYRYSNEGDYFEAVRSDTANHIILAGIWRMEMEAGSFFAVFPRKD